MEGGYPPNNPTYYGFKSEGGADFSIMEIKGAKSYDRLNFNIGNEVDALWKKLKNKTTVI